MQGCGKLLFPWTKKYKIPGFNTYCCKACFERDYNLLTKPAENTRDLRLTQREEYYDSDESANFIVTGCKPEDKNN